MNFKNFADPVGGEGRDPKQTDNIFPLVGQSSIYSLTLDEFQNTLGGLGKDFGSMNMDELLKNIWTAEETQTTSSSGVPLQPCTVPVGNLQRQGSLTLPRTLSQKTVDEVWRDLLNKESNNIGGSNGSNVPQGQQTLGEITLEEFLARAGVVKEDGDTPQMGRPDYNNGVSSKTKTGLAIGFNQLVQNTALLGSRNNSAVPNRQPGLGPDASVVRQQKLQPQNLFPKQVNVAFATPVNLANNNNNNLVGVGDNSFNNNGSLDGLGTGIMVASPGVSSVDNSSLSPVPYVYGRGRRSNAALEKVIERRQRRMIKNRESAARSRARKQAYTLELEAEVAKLKEMNQELQGKHAELMEMQKNKLKECTNRPQGCKRRCLRRTLTGPW